MQPLCLQGGLPVTVTPGLLKLKVLGPFIWVENQPYPPPRSYTYRPPAMTDR